MQMLLYKKIVFSYKNKRYKNVTPAMSVEENPFGVSMILLFIVIGSTFFLFFSDRTLVAVLHYTTPLSQRVGRKRAALCDSHPMDCDGTGYGSAWRSGRAGF